MLSFEFSSPVWREEAHGLVEPAPESVSPYRVELGFAPSVWREAHGLVADANEDQPHTRDDDCKYERCQTKDLGVFTCMLPHEEKLPT